MNRKMAATPKLGAKNQLDCPKGYIRKTLTNTDMGAENAIALYGRIPTNRAISNCRNMNPINPKAPCSATNGHSPPI